MSGFWQRLWSKPNGHDAELDALREEMSASQQKVREAARKLARAAESVSQRKKHDDFQRMIPRLRASEGHD